MEDTAVSKESTTQAPPVAPAGEAIRPKSDFLKKAEAESGVNINACYGCKKCSNGCPLTFAMDLHPYQIVRYVQFGLEEKLKNCETLWVCSSCQTCLTRCPNEVDLPRMMDYLKETVVKEKRSVNQKNTVLFHQSFLKEIKARGRIFETGLMTRYIILSGDFINPSMAIKHGKLGLAMLKRGRLPLWPKGIKDRKWLKELFKD